MTTLNDKTRHEIIMNPLVSHLAFICLHMNSLPSIVSYVHILLLCYIGSLGLGPGHFVCVTYSSVSVSIC